MVAVVRAVYDEYGFTWEADGYHRDLYEIDKSYRLRGGMFWALEAADRAVGCAGVLMHDGGVCELHRMYLLPSYRGRGLGRLLLETAMTFGREHGCHRMIAWSDVKLIHAHKLYLKRGFVQEGERICDDPDQAREYGFWREPL